jgi:hypothetical protein
MQSTIIRNPKNQTSAAPSKKGPGRASYPETFVLSPSRWNGKINDKVLDRYGISIAGSTREDAANIWINLQKLNFQKDFWTAIAIGNALRDRFVANGVRTERFLG